MNKMKIGTGYDVHALVIGRKLIIGGVEIPHDKGLLGHSDADVLIHAIMDSILGALGKRDIGCVFPDNDQKYKDISSLLLLDEIYKIMNDEGYAISNIDSIIVAQKPKMAPYIDEMIKNIAKHLHTDIENVNVKATTTEHLGFEGEEKGISSTAVCLLMKIR